MKKFCMLVMTIAFVWMCASYVELNREAMRSLQETPKTVVVADNIVVTSGESADSATTATTTSPTEKPYSDGNGGKTYYDPQNCEGHGAALTHPVGFAELDSPAKSDELLSSEDFMKMLIEEVRTTAEKAEFNPDRAVEYLADRHNAYEVLLAESTQNPQDLDWVFAEVLVGPTQTKGGQCEMVVKPISALTDETLPAELTIFTYTRYCESGVKKSDVVLFPVITSGLDRPIPSSDGEVIWRTYVYGIITSE